MGQSLDSDKAGQNAPLASQIMVHPELADTFEAVATDGREGYYKGRIAQGAHF